MSTEAAALGQETAGAGLLFVVHKHAARRLHYDLRFEIDGMLKSWLMPHGPSSNPKRPRTARIVPDRRLQEAHLEGVVLPAERGAGAVIIWDRGRYSPEEGGSTFFDDRASAEKIMRDQIARGTVRIVLRGSKLRGLWTLRRSGSKTGREAAWKIVKVRDQFAEPVKDVLRDGASVVSGLSIEDLKSRAVLARP